MNGDVATIKFSSGFNPYNIDDMDDVYSCDTDYLTKLHFDMDALLTQYKRCVMMSALSLLERGGTYTVHMPYNASYNDGPVEVMISYLLWAIARCKTNSLSLDEVSYGLPYPGGLPSATWCRDYLNAIRSHFDNTSTVFDVQSSFNVKTQPANGGWGGRYVGSLMNGVSSCFRPLIDVIGLGLGLRVSGEEWDQLIPPPSVNLPDFSTAEVIAAIGLIIGAVGAAFLTSKSISRKLKARRQVKMARRTQLLNEKRNAYLNNPHDKELKKEYTSALVSYDKRASLFGWPSYDAVNGRMNVSAQGSTASSVLNGFLNTTDTTEYIASLIK
jgi:hypothetical protein